MWHVPNAETVSIRRFVELVFEQLRRPTRIQTVPLLIINALAPVVPAMRALKETMYQSQRPWVVDHSKYARMFAERHTPYDIGISKTIEWFRAA